MGDSSDNVRRSTSAGSTTRLHRVEETDGPGGGVRAFPWHALSEVPRDRQAAINRLVRYLPISHGTRSGAPVETGGALSSAAAGAMAEATGLEHALRWRGIRLHRPESYAWPIDGGHISRVEWPGSSGVGALAISREPVGEWLEAMLDEGLAFEQVPAPLTPEESGLITYILCMARNALVAEGLPPVELSVEPPDEALLKRLITRSGGAAELSWMLRAGRSAGFARLLVPLGWLEKLGVEHVESSKRQYVKHNTAAAAVRLACPVHVARVRVDATEFRRLSTGSVVVLNEHGFGDGICGVKHAGARGGAHLELNSETHLPGVVRARTTSDLWEFQVRAVAVRRMTRVPTPQHTETTMNDRPEESSTEEHAETGREAEPEGVAPTQMLEQPDVQLEVSLGEATVSVAELIDLREGAVLELSTRPGEPVDVRANGRKVATGELVTIEGHLGVRILERL